MQRFVIVCGTVLTLALTGCSREPSSAGGDTTARMLTEAQYRQSISDIFGSDLKFGGRFEPRVRQNGLLSLGDAVVTVTPVGMEQYDGMARAIAEQVVDEKHRDKLVPCTPEPETFDASCAGKFFQQYGRLLYRRPLTEAEWKERVDAAAATAARFGNFHAGLQYGLATLLVSPNFLYRVERAIPDSRNSGSWHLDAFSTASRLSFLLWNSGPDDALLRTAEDSSLLDQHVLEQQVDRMLASPRLEAGARAFVADMFGLDKFSELTKDPLAYPQFSQQLSAQLQEQFLRTAVDFLFTQKQDYRDLFTTRQSFMTKLLGAVYRVPTPTRELGPDGWMKYEFPADAPRMGMLTSITFLALNAHAARSSPTLRGKALRELVLCTKVPDPPANVDFKLVDDTANKEYPTARSRLLVHSTDPTCAGCHHVMDPVGLGLEQFDGIGVYRTVENGTPIDVSGDLDGTEYRDLSGLANSVRNHPQLPSCLTERLYAYAAGTPAGHGEWLNYLQERFAAEGYRIPRLMRTIATSEALYRIKAEEPERRTAFEISRTSSRGE